MKPTKCPAKEKNESRKKREQRKRKAKRQDCWVTFKPKISKFGFEYFASGSEGRKVYDL